MLTKCRKGEDYISKEVKEITELDCFSLTGIADKQFIGIYELGENEDKVLFQVVNLEHFVVGGGSKSNRLASC